MIWLIIWAASVIINVVIILKFVKKEKSKVTYFNLLSFLIFGIIIAPLLTGFVLIAKTIKFCNKLSNADIMNKTIYKFK